jgi:hypothetical protein
MRSQQMTGHSDVLDRYKRTREVRFRLNNRIVKTIPTKTMQECGRMLDLYRRGTFVFDSEDESTLLMEFCLYYPDRDGRNLVMDYLEKSRASADSEEIAILQAMTRAYYSLFQITDVEPGVGIGVEDLLRDEASFIVDVGFGNTARRHFVLATRVIPFEGLLTTAGAALPVDASAARQVFDALRRTGLGPENFDYRKITPRQEAEVASLVIRTCRSTGMSSRVAYEDPGGSSPRSPVVSESPRVGRNERCPCGSGKKFKICCGRQ